MCLEQPISDFPYENFLKSNTQLGSDYAIDIDNLTQRRKICVLYVIRFAIFFEEGKYIKQTLEPRDSAGLS